MKVKDVWLGKTVTPLWLKAMFERKAHNSKKIKKKKKKKVEKSTELGVNGKETQVYMESYVEIYTYYI